METAIRWSPSSTTLEQRFLIADVNGRAFRHCRVEKYDGTSLQYEIISTHRMVPAFRAFDWSPQDEAIVAVGQWSGEATVLRIDDQSQSLSLPIKHQRLCNAVTFSRTGLLATGLERVRNDFCLNVWDISQRPLINSSTPSSGRVSMDPVRKLASSEAITSIKFFPSQPDVLVCGIKGASVRIYDTRDPAGNSSFQSQTTCVYNIAIDPLDENYFASAGSLKDTTIHIFDRRSGPSSTAAILGAGSAQSTQQGPILEFKKAFEAVGSSMQANIWSLRYCKGQSGCLAALASTGDYKIFETKKEYTPKGVRVEGSSQPAKDHQDYIAASPQRIFAQRIHHIEHAFDYQKHSRSEKKRIVSFDFTNLAGCRGRPCAVTLRGDQTIEIYELKGPSRDLSISPMGSLAISRARPMRNMELPITDRVPLPVLVRLISPSEDTSIAESMRDARARLIGNRAVKGIRLPRRMKNYSLKDEIEKGHLSSREAHEALHTLQPSNVKLDMQSALSLFTVYRRRAAEGYLVDCSRNMEIVSDDPWLQDLWAWIGRTSRLVFH
jgi:WD40 repeat protein